MSRTERLLALAEHLRGRRTGTTAAALADRFSVTERTIYRDLGALRAAHLPIQGERGRGGGLKLDHHYTLPPVNFTPREGALLVACGEWLSASRMLPFVDTLGQAVDKLRAALPRQRQAELDRLRGALAFTGVPYIEGYIGVMWTVLREQQYLSPTGEDFGLEVPDEGQGAWTAEVGLSVDYRLFDMGFVGLAVRWSEVFGHTLHRRFVTVPIEISYYW